MRDNMADETIINAPSTKTARTVPIGAEVTPGETTGKLRVFDSGVDDFPDTSGLGFQAIAIDGTETKSLATYWGQETGVFPQNFKAKRSITLLADGSNSIPVYVGDANTAANSTAADCVGFPLKADASITLEITDPSRIFLDATASGPVIYWIAV